MLHVSARTSSTTKLPYDPFLLKEELKNMPTLLEITFILNDCKYRYGFSYLEDRISKEWLYRKKIDREVPLFLREEDAIDASSGFRGNTKVIDAAIDATRNKTPLTANPCTKVHHLVKELREWIKYYRD